MKPSLHTASASLVWEAEAIKKKTLNGLICVTAQFSEKKNSDNGGCPMKMRSVFTYISNEFF